MDIFGFSTQELRKALEIKAQRDPNTRSIDEEFPELLEQFLVEMTSGITNVS